MYVVNAILCQISEYLGNLGRQQRYVNKLCGDSKKKGFSLFEFVDDTCVTFPSRLCLSTCFLLVRLDDAGLVSLRSESLLVLLDIAGKLPDSAVFTDPEALTHCL